jgi:nucleotide-binding universal stress UspA family protein
MSILVATDFEVCSRAATSCALDLAERLGEPVRFIHVIEPSTLLSPGIPLGSAGFELQVKQAADERLGRLVESAARRGVAADGGVLFGPAGDQILEAAREHKSTLIVLGTHGRRGPALFFLGSVAERVAKAAPCPVLVAREPRPARPPRAGRALHVLVALDGDPADDGAVAWVKELRRQTPCDVTFLRVYWPPREAARFGVEVPWHRHEGSPELVGLLDRELARRVGDIPGTGAVFRRFHANRGPGSEALADEVALLLPDMVVVGTHEKRWLGPWPSLAPTAVLHAVHAPVVCVPATPRAAANREIPRLRSVLVPADLSDESAATVPAAYALLRGTGGVVELLHVHERGPGGAVAPEASLLPALTDAERAATEARLRALVPPEAEALGITTRVSVVEGRHAAEGILQAAERLDVDAVALAPHGRGRVGRALLGSVTERVVGSSRRPVFVLPAS